MGKHLSLIPAISFFNRITSKWRKDPYFFIIGTQKGGTTSLFYYLRQHPDLALAIRKEVHFFDCNYQKGMGFYKSFFPLDINNRRSGESSPYYMFHPLTPARIKTHYPNAKLILLLRDPAERAYSHFKHNKARGSREISQTFKEALELEKERIKREKEKMIADPHYKSYNHQHFSYLERGKYGQQIKRWLQYFSRDQMLIIRSENFYNQPQACLKVCYDFLKLKESYPKNLKVKNQGDGKSHVASETKEKLDLFFKEDQKLLMDCIGNYDF